MEVKLHPSYEDNLIARQGAAAIEACVHCGFCLATCPTYLLNRDERDSPRGRIYLVKEMLESGEGSKRAQFHLDRCLSCRSCETTCPSGVQYAEIADAGRVLLESAGLRGLFDRCQRRLLRLVVPRPALFTPLLRLGQTLRFALPLFLREKVPEQQHRIRVKATTESQATVLLLDGCVQRSATPTTNDAARKLLSALKVTVAELPRNGCCGAVDAHLGAHDAALDQYRRNIDTWWPAIAGGAEAIISTATGCGAQVVDYAKALAHDPAYAEKARRVSALCRDLSVYLTECKNTLPPVPDKKSLALRVAVQVPCSQTHALSHSDSVALLLEERGFQLAETQDDHLCCGSAGTYSLLQPDLSRELQRNKLAALCTDEPDVIVSANVGCQLHLAQKSPVPVMHWAVLLSQTLPD